jgi:hypothetical protein
MAYAKINSITNANMAKVNSAAKATLGKIGSIDAPAASFVNTYSLDFDGTNDHLVSGSSITFDRGTIAFWQKTHFIGSEAEGDGNFIPFHLDSTFYIYMSWNSIITRPYVIHPASGSFFDNTSDIADGEWHHIALTIAGGGSGAENTSIIYVDGEVGRTVTSTRTYTAPSDTIKFGGNFSSSYYMDGNLDELGIWSSALSGSEITAIYNSGAPTDLTVDAGNYVSSGSLTGYWRMGDGDTYSTIEDNVGSNDMEMTNMGEEDLVEDVPS